MMDRIMIIGLNGSGKSTLANKLGSILGREVTHLDKLYFKPGWNAVSKEEWKEIVTNLLAQDKWIIDGSYPSSMDRRAERADLIIWLKFSKIKCLYRIIKRCFSKIQPFDRPEGDFHKISWYLVWKILKYSKRKIAKKLEPYKNSRKLVILHNDNEVAQFLATLVK